MLKLINGWTKEKVLEQVKKYNNGKQSATVNGRCLYENPKDNNRCFVGCFIPDGHEALEAAERASELLWAFPDLVRKMPFNPADLDEFQKEHDCARNPSKVHKYLQSFLKDKVAD